ncbi:MAG TPA: LamG-like jellyroll fold domain-containing protein [Candidatus Acidoferrum sp.]|nr:LamG-like jellyroll fold domain-containing protein [Candidatus Acidoferrum sp.]
MKPTQPLKSLVLLLSMLVPLLAHANLVGPYTADANTLVLLHFDEAAGGTVTANVGSLGGNFYSVNEATASATPPTVTTMLGAAGYVNGLTNFHNCMTNPTTGYLFGYDYNNSGAYQGDVSSSSQSADRLAMSVLNIGNGGQTPFSLEALIQPTTTSGNQEIICTDNSTGNSTRGFQFRITSGSLQFSFIANSQALTATIPTSGTDPNAFVAGAWFHVAFTYDGTKGTLYWTRLDPSIGAANVISSGNMTLGTSDGAVQSPLCIGNENRNSAGEQFLGSIDEVRISSVCRAANQMQFFSPLVTITQNPVSQNVDYNQPVSFTVGASSLTQLGYQWRFNSNSITAGTNATYTITNVAAANAGHYDCVVTNLAGYAATSTPALMVVGAANFLNHRYSFTNDTSDSIGGSAWNGTLYGDAVVSNGVLVLDGTSGTYMQLPGNVFNATNATALTVEFWATFGANSANCYVFSLGYTNVVSGTVQGSKYVCYSPHTSTGQGLLMSPADNIFQQQVTTSTTLDGSTTHVACVIDPPNQTLAIYTNGVLAAANTNMTIGLANVNDVFSYIGASLFAADPYLVANIDELRIYLGALSGISIKQSDDQGPNIVLATGPAKFAVQPQSASVPLGWPATFSAAAVGYLPISYQWFKNGALVPGATNASYSFVPTLGDNNASVVCYATNSIGVTTYFTNSQPAMLTVFTPPTLSWLGEYAGGVDSLWNTGSPDWTNDASGGGVIMFAQTNAVLFDDRTPGADVDLTGAMIPYSITVHASSHDYVFTSSSQLGSLVGQGALTKLGTDTLILDVPDGMSGPVTISGGTLQIGYNDAFGSLGSGPVTNAATLSFARSDTALAVPNAIHGSGTLSFNGSGAVTLSGNSDYTGPTLLNAGIVYLTSSTALGSPSTGTTVANGAQLYITANVDMAEPLTITGAGDSNGALRKGGAGATVENGPVMLAGDSTIGLDSGATLTLSNVVSGTAALTIVGSGTLTLSANNTFSGGFSLDGSVNTPIINVDATHALGAGPVTVIGTGRFVIGDGLNVPNAFTANLISPAVGYGVIMVNDNTNGTVTTVSGPITFTDLPVNGGDFVGPTTSGYLNVTGPVTNTANGVVTSRAGLVRFSGGGDYTLFMLNAGTLSIGANDGLCPKASVTMAASADAILDLNGFSQALTGLTDGATFAEVVTNSAATPSTLTLNLGADDTYSGALAGNLALVENGASTLILQGTNSYTGNTTVNGGTLTIAQPTLSAGSTITLASGALLQLNFTGTNAVRGLVLGGAPQVAGVYNNTTTPTFITGSGSLLVSLATNPTNMVFSVSGTNLNLSWPSDHLGWTLQTNAVSVADPNAWFAWPGSSGTNSLQIPIGPATPRVFFRLVSH